MAVKKSKRNESTVQFLSIALELEEFTIRQCMKLPKRTTFFLGQRIANLASDIADSVKSANSIYADSIFEFEMREKFFVEAECYIQCLISKITLLKRLYPTELTEHAWVEWNTKLIDLTRLISGVKKRDNEKKKDLIDKQKI